MIPVMEVKIAVVSKAIIYDCCPNCKSKNLILEGRPNPMIDWKECLDCKTWYHPDIIFNLPRREE
jgi:hypothetical protein